MKSLADSISECKRVTVLKALELTKGNVLAAARLLDIRSDTLYEIIKRTGINRTQFKPAHSKLKENTHGSREKQKQDREFQYQERVTSSKVSWFN